MVNFCRCILIFSFIFDEVRKIVSTLMMLTNLSISSKQWRSDEANIHRESLEKNRGENKSVHCY